MSNVKFRFLLVIGVLLALAAISYFSERSERLRNQKVDDFENHSEIKDTLK